MVPQDYVNSSAALGGPKLAPKEVNKVIKDAQQPVYEDIRRLLGEENYKEFKDYNGSLTERYQFEDLNQSLGPGVAPFTDAQIDFLASNMAEMKSKVRSANNGSMPLREPTEQVSARYDELLRRAQSVLSADQLAELKRGLAGDLDLRIQEETIIKKFLPSATAPH
jgi:hypothetical protein